MIELEHVSVAFASGSSTDPFQALSDVNLQVEKGRFVSLVGPSGCGKSTVLNMIAGLLRPTEGVVNYDDREVRGFNTKVGYLTQQDTLLPWRRVDRNVGLALELRHVPKDVRRERTAAALAQVGLADFARYYPSQLSGGMKKRAALARTLVYEPETLLMDEPYGAIDAILRVSLHEMLLALWERQNLTVVFVTHDLEEALLLSDEVVVFGTRPGRILHIEQVPFGRPRDIRTLRSDPDFRDILAKLWSYLGMSAESES